MKKMILIDGVEYKRINEVAKILGVHPNTLRNWDKFSEELEELGKERLIPKPYKMGAKGIRHWNEEDIAELRKFRDSDKYGQLAYFNRAEWGERGRHLPNRKNS